MLNKNTENFTWFQKLNKISEWKKPKQKIQCTHKKRLWIWKSIDCYKRKDSYNTIVTPIKTCILTIKIQRQ